MKRNSAIPEKWYIKGCKEFQDYCCSKHPNIDISITNMDGGNTSYYYIKKKI